MKKITLQDKSLSSQESFLHKLKNRLFKFISWRRHSFAVDAFRPKTNEPARQDSLTFDNYDFSENEDDGDTQLNSDLQQSIYTKDDDFERKRYNQASRRASAITLQTPPSILVKTPNHHRHTKSLQSAYIPGHSRHTSHISFLSASNITVNSEDLTAKEFADMAGIKINNDTEQEVIVHPPSCHDWSILSTGSAHSHQSSTKIWDTGFWKRPEERANPPLRKHRSALLKHRQTSSLPPPPVSKSHGHGKSKSACDLPIVHELLRIHSVSEPPVIRKGRFQVQLDR